MNHLSHVAHLTCRRTALARRLVPFRPWSVPNYAGARPPCRRAVARLLGRAAMPVAIVERDGDA